MSEELKITGEIPVKAFLVYCYVCKIENGCSKYLLLKRENPYLRDTWQPVTGRVEGGELAWQTVLREMKEETGLQPYKLYSCNVVERFYEASTNTICLAPVFLAFVSTEREVELSPEHKEYKWLLPSMADEHLTFPQQKETLKYIEEEFIQKEPLPFLDIKYNV